MGLSNLGIFHTLIGIIAIIAAIVSYIQYSKINLATVPGKIYFYGTLITALTALGIYGHGGFNPGHVGSILVCILVLTAYFLFSRKKHSKIACHFENFL